MNDPPDWNQDDEIDTRKPLLLRVIAALVIVGLVVYIADLFFRLLIERL